MSPVRLLILAVAVITGAAAFLLLRSSDEPVKVIAAAIPEREPEPMVRVLFSKRDVRQGTALSEDIIKWVEWPEKSVPDFYITDERTDFIESLPQRRARLDIRENEPIYAENTVKHGDRGMMSAIMTPGMRAVTAEVNIEQISGGFILPGDRVDVYASGIEAHSLNIGNPNETEARIVLSNVRVLAIDQVYATNAETMAISGRTVTVELHPNEVRAFIEARDNHTLTVVLRSVFDGARPSTNLTPKEPAEVVVIRYGQG